MSVLSDFRTMVLADSGVSTLVSTRMYPQVLPQNPTYPAITYELIDSDPHLDLQGESTLKWARIRVQTWGAITSNDNGIGSAYEVIQAIETAVHSQKTTNLRSIIGSSARQMFSTELDRGYFVEDFSIWHR